MRKSLELNKKKNSSIFALANSWRNFIYSGDTLQLTNLMIDSKWMGKKIQISLIPNNHHAFTMFAAKDITNFGHFIFQHHDLSRFFCFRLVILCTSIRIQITYEGDQAQSSNVTSQFFHFSVDICSQRNSLNMQCYSSTQYFLN